MTLLEWLYLGGRMPLTQTEHALVPILARAFWPGGQKLRNHTARITASWAHRMGAGAAPVHASRALRSLVGREMLDRVGGHEYHIRHPDQWRWPARLRETWQAERAYLTDPAAAWGGQVDLAGALLTALRALGHHPTAHPADPLLEAWIAAIGPIADQVGTDVVAAALEEVAIDPLALLPATPVGFALHLFALAQRARRRREAHP